MFFLQIELPWACDFRLQKQQRYVLKTYLVDFIVVSASETGIICNRHGRQWENIIIR